MTRYGLIGAGRIGRRIAGLLADRADAPHLVGMLVRPGQEAPGGMGCTDLASLIARQPDVVVEAASAAALAEHGPALLRAGIDVIPLSLAAMADRGIEQSLRDAALAGPGRLDIPAGAMGSLDALRAAREGGLSRVLFRASNGPVGWRRTRAAELIDLDQPSGPALILRGTVREVAALFPRNLNVAVGVALAGLGLDGTEAELMLEPGLKQARFEIHAWAEPGPFTLCVHGPDRPAGADPVDYTTFSVLRLLLRRDERLRV